jgi:hypothetical protein
LIGAQSGDYALSRTNALDLVRPDAELGKLNSDCRASSESHPCATPFTGASTGGEAPVHVPASPHVGAWRWARLVDLAAAAPWIPTLRSQKDCAERAALKPERVGGLCSFTWFLHRGGSGLRTRLSIHLAFAGRGGFQGRQCRFSPRAMDPAIGSTCNHRKNRRPRTLRDFEFDAERMDG